MGSIVIALAAVSAALNHNIVPAVGPVVPHPMAHLRSVHATSLLFLASLYRASATAACAAATRAIGMRNGEQLT
jgi:hypothetical protein